LDIDLLKTFLEVKKTRHFGKAAENLYLTQAAVSARIKQLERLLGAQLFTRYRNNLQLTPVGDRFISHAETILLAWERAQSEVSLKKNQKRVLTIGGTSGLWDLILQDVLHKIHIKLPDLALRAESEPQDELIRRLMERTMDFALIYEPAKLSEIESIVVAKSELILVSREKLQAVNFAINNNYVFIDWGTAFKITHAQLFQDANAPVLHTTLAKIALDFILQNGGSAYLPSRMVKRHIEIGELYHIDSAPTITRPIYACYHHENINIEAFNQIIEIVEQIE
jgi:DNA-binding transcriptional LysR family regulator